MSSKNADDASNNSKPDSRIIYDKMDVTDKAYDELKSRNEHELSVINKLFLFGIPGFVFMVCMVSLNSIGYVKLSDPVLVALIATTGASSVLAKYVGRRGT